MPAVRVNGVKLNYRQTGTGPDLVLVHGLGASQAFWNLGLVAGLAAEFRVTTFDLRGHGYSAMPPTGYRPADLALDLHGLLHHLNIGPVHLVGHSYGGLIALQFALGEPQRVRSLVIADTRLRGLQPRQVVTASPEWPELRALLARHGIVLRDDEPEIGFCLLEAFASLTWNKTRAGEAGRPGYLPFGGAGTRSAQRWRDLLAVTSLERDFREGADLAAAQLAQLRVPVLAVYGDQSPTRPSGVGLAECLPDCRLLFVPGGKHFHPATNPQFFGDAVRAFLRTLGAQTREWASWMLCAAAEGSGVPLT